MDRTTLSLSAVRSVRLPRTTERPVYECGMNVVNPEGHGPASDVSLWYGDLHAAVFLIDKPADLIDAVSLLYHLRRIQRLSLTDVHSGGRVAVDETGKQITMAQMLVALAVAVKPIEHFGNFMRDLVGARCLPDKQRRRHRNSGFAPHVAARTRQRLIGSAARSSRDDPRPCDNTDD